jgi:hypothetical protein
MKRVLYFLLMVWIALQSALVQAHMVGESLHQLSHTAQAIGDAVLDAEHDELCVEVVCSHPVGAMYQSPNLSWGQMSSSPPSTVLLLQSAHALDDIERPKWPTAAPGVAGI